MGPGEGSVIKFLNLIQRRTLLTSYICNFSTKDFMDQVENENCLPGQSFGENYGIEWHLPISDGIGVSRTDVRYTGRCELSEYSTIIHFKWRNMKMFE